MPVAVRTLLTFVLAIAGAYAFSFTSIPGSQLMGGAVAVSLASMLGFKAVVPMRARDVLFVFIGLSMGSGVSPDTLNLLGQWPITLTALTIELAVLVVVCSIFLNAVLKLDKATACLSTFPGHLSFIVALATAGAGDSRTITIIQVMRVTLLTLIVPIGALFLPVGDYVPPEAEPMAPMTLVMVGLGCAFTGWVFTKLRIAAAFVLGSMAFATTMKLTGNFDGQMPRLIIDLTFACMGGLIGSRFAGLGRDEIMKAAAAGIVTTIIMMVIVTIFCYGLTFLVDMPFAQLWLAFAPGGLESMGALGIALGYDTAFIAGHHVFRLLILVFAIPIIATLFKPKPETSTA